MLHFSCYHKRPNNTKCLLQKGAKELLEDVDMKVGARDPTTSSPPRGIYIQCSRLYKYLPPFLDPLALGLSKWLSHVCQLAARQVRPFVSMEERCSFSPQSSHPLPFLAYSQSAELINRPDIAGNTPAHLASGNGHQNVLKVAVVVFAPLAIPHVPPFRYPPDTPRPRHPPTDPKVLARLPGIHLDSRDKYGRTPLHWAAAGCQEKAVTTLLSFGVSGAAATRSINSTAAGASARRRIAISSSPFLLHHHRRILAYRIAKALHLSATRTKETRCPR